MGAAEVVAALFLPTRRQFICKSKRMETCPSKYQEGDLNDQILIFY